MWGLSLDAWNNIIVAFLGVTAAAALVVVVATYIAFQLQKLEAKQASDALERYKIGVAAQVADAKREGIEAGKTAGDAMLRAAGLEKEAADARLQTERLKAQLAWRTLSADEAAALKAALAKHPGSVNLRYMDGDPEALFFAIQISRLLGETQWAIAPGAVKPANTIVFGISLPDSEGPDAVALREAFSAAHLPFGTDPLPQAGASFNVSTIDGAPILMVGSKQPVFP
jgi:hypothetical protein